MESQTFSSGKKRLRPEEYFLRLKNNLPGNLQVAVQDFQHVGGRGGALQGIAAFLTASSPLP